MKNQRLHNIFVDISTFETDIENPTLTGAFYTNYDVAYQIVENALNINTIKGKYTLEPANGCGIFTFSYIELLITKYNIQEVEEIMNNYYYYIDIDVKSYNKFNELIKKYYPEYNFQIKSICMDSLKTNLDFFKGVFGNDFEGFDYIIGNPPYGVSDQDNKKILSKRYKESLSSDTYGLFYVHAYFLLKKNGILTFITPKSFFGIKTFYGVRKIILNDIESIIICPKNIFKNYTNGLSPSVDTCITKIKKDTDVKNIIVYDNINNSYKNSEYIFEYNNSYIINKLFISEIHNSPIVYNLDSNLNLLLSKKYELKISDIFESAMGIKTADNKRFISKSGKLPFVKGTSTHQQMFFSNNDGYLDLEILKKNKLKNTNIPQDKFLDLNKYKLGMPEIGHNGEVCSFIYKEGYVSNSVWIYILKEGFNEKWLYVLLGLINTPIYKSLSKMYSSGFRIEKHDIDSLPIIISEQDKEFNEIYNIVKNIIDSGEDNNIINDGILNINNLLLSKLQ